MVIDVHVHPAFYGPICDDKNRLLKRKQVMGYDLMSPFPLELVEKQMAFANIDKLVLLPEDTETIDGEIVISNEEIKKLIDLDPQRFIGFASVDPNKKDAAAILEHALKDLNLKGLALYPSKQHVYPNDPALFPLYEICLEHNVPITFDAGMSWQPNTLLKYAHPYLIEEVAVRYPQLRMNISHFGFPWTLETAAIILKYPNVYADTAGVYMDCPEQFFSDIFQKMMGSLWIEHNIADKILFGSNNPRFRPARIKRGLESLPLSKITMDKLLGGNAANFLGLEG